MERAVYKKFVSIKEFCELSGVKETFFRQRVLHSSKFKPFVFRPTHKYLIKTEPAMEALDDVFEEIEMLQQ